MVPLLILGGCNLTKLVPDGENLLQSNKVKGLQYSATKTEILSQVKLKPNRKILFIKTHLWVYQIGKQFNLVKIGEKPVLVDTALVISSTQNIERYLFKKGYFNNQVTYEINKSWLSGLLGQKKLKVNYLVEEGKRYSISNISYHSANPNIHQFVHQNLDKSLLKEGSNVDYGLMSEERSRINTLMKNNGYYFFNQSYVEFVVDSAMGNYTSRIEVHILDPQHGKHTQQRIHSVEVSFFTGQETNDSILDLNTGFVYRLNGMDIQIDVLNKNILFRNGELFSQQKLQNTYLRLVGLDLFNGLSIQSNLHEGDSSLLDMKILLTPSAKYDFTWQPQLISTEQRFNQSQSSRNYGLANEFSVKNKNVFHNGEEWSLNFRTALETQFTRDSNNIFSTFIQEVNSDLKIPQLLFFNQLGNTPNIKSAYTHINASYLYENNPFYRRNLFPLSFTYQVDRDQSQVFVSPLLISLNKAEYKASLVEQASQRYIETLERLFTNNLITSVKISGVFSSQSKSPESYFVVNSNLLELAGIYAPLLTNYGKKLGVNHSTFIRSDVDFRYHYKFNENHEFVVRAFAGAGIPVGDRSVLPYERRFIAGGSNYMRGWRIRTVGPGSFTTNNNLQFTRTGEVGLMGNLEYRFNILRGAVDLNGAIFGDVGNVWNLKADTLFPGGEIKADRFYNEFAFNTGLGLRFDFDFLLLRFDLGVPVWDPNFPLAERLVIHDPLRDLWIFRRPVWNVAVGYPF